MSQYANYPKFKAWKANGSSPASGYYLYTYEAGTTNPKATYNSAALDNANANPIVLDANGEANIFLGSGSYRFDLKTPAGSLVWTFQPIVGASVTLTTVNTIEELRALSSQGFSLVNVLGYFSAGDGAGGTFYFDPSSSRPDDNGLIIIPNSLPSLGRWIRLYEKEIVKPEWFGNFSLNSVISILGTTNTRLVISTEVTLSADLTIPSTIEIEVVKGGSIALNSYTLTFSNELLDTANTVFTGTGSVRGLKIVRPEWWGIDGASDNIPFQKAVDSLSVAGGVIKLFPKTYIWAQDQRVTLASNIYIKGSTTGKTIIGLGAGSNRLNTSGANNQAGFFEISAVDNVEISDISIISKGTWTATPFVSSVGGGNSVGFTNVDSGIRVLGNCLNLYIHNCYFYGLQQPLRTSGASGWRTNFKYCNNREENSGQGTYIQRATNVLYDGNVVSGVYGNQTDPGVTSTAESKFADGVYFSQNNILICSNNEIEDVCRIGIVIESSGGYVSKGIVIEGNIIHNLHDYKGTEYNAGIWVENGKAEEPCILSNNVIYDAHGDRGLGIQAAVCSIQGGSIRYCDAIGISMGENVTVKNVTVKDNYRAFSIATSDTSQTMIIEGCTIENNTRGGILIYQSKGKFSIKGNIIQNNGTTWSTSVNGMNGNHGIRIERMYTTQFIDISGNTFISSANANALTGQLYGIEQVSGGDFASSTKGIRNNNFIFTGTLSAYPTSITEVPCAYATNNTVAVTFQDIVGGWEGNSNTKITPPDLSVTTQAGCPRFVGFSNVTPATGTGRVGDFYINRAFASGGAFAWICTVAGSPGTWEQIGWGMFVSLTTLNVATSLYPNISTRVAQVGGIIKTLSTQVNNSLAAETDLQAYTVPANTLWAQGSSLEVFCTGFFNGNANGKTLRVYYAGVKIFDTGSIAFNNTRWELSINLIRYDSITVRYSVRFGTNDALKTAAMDFAGTTLTDDRTIDEIFKVTGQGAASSDISQTYTRIKWNPAYA